MFQIISEQHTDRILYASQPFDMFGESEHNQRLQNMRKRIMLQSSVAAPTSAILESNNSNLGIQAIFNANHGLVISTDFQECFESPNIPTDAICTTSYVESEKTASGHLLQNTYSNRSCFVEQNDELL
jgi:hypothetical protein